MAFRIKQEMPAPEVEIARAKLDEALQCVMDKVEESPSGSEDEKYMLDIEIKKEPSPVSTPTKKSAKRAQRKRRKKDETLYKNTNSYVMKLFDRAVDLTTFTEQTPLYPICRSWINNQSVFNPQPKEEPQTDEHENCKDSEKASEETDSEDIWKLPPPEPLPSNGKDLRIPSPIPQPEEDFIICSEDHDVVPRELLLAKHIHRWKEVRKKWKQAAKANEDRYKDSAAILKTVFETALAT